LSRVQTLETNIATNLLITTFSCKEIVVVAWHLPSRRIVGGFKYPQKIIHHVFAAIASAYRNNIVFFYFKNKISWPEA